MSGNSGDEEIAREKLKQLDYLESMRHLQTLEATEMGFVIAAYGLVINGLVRAGHSFWASETFRVLFHLSLLLAALLIWHFCARRSTYYWLRDRHHELLKQRGWTHSIKPGRSLFGIAMRVGVIVVLTLAVVLTAGCLSGRSAQDGFVQTGVFLLMLVPAAAIGAEASQARTLSRKVYISYTYAHKTNPVVFHPKYEQFVKRWPSLRACITVMVVLSLLAVVLVSRLASSCGQDPRLALAILLPVYILGLLIGMDVGERRMLKRKVKVTRWDREEHEITLRKLPEQLLRTGDKIGGWEPKHPS